MAKASKKYEKQRFEYAHMHEYLPKAWKDDLRGSTTKKPRFDKKPAVSSEKKNRKIRSTKIDHPYES